MTSLEELSGRIDTLDQTALFLQQSILQRPDITAYSSIQGIWNQSFNSLNTNLNTLIQKISSLYSLYTNLNISVASNYAVFTGHSGQSGIHFTEPWDTRSITGTSYTATATDNALVTNAINNNITITMPSVTAVSGRPYTIKKVDNTANNVTITGNATFDGAGSLTLSGQYNYYNLFSNGTEWLLF